MKTRMIKLNGKNEIAPGVNRWTVRMVVAGHVHHAIGTATYFPTADLWSFKGLKFGRLQFPDAQFEGPNGRAAMIAELRK